MKIIIMLLILITGTIINSFSQSLSFEELKQTIEGQSFIELNRLHQLIEKKEYEKAVVFIMNSNIEKHNSFELLISKDKQYILSFDEFNELQKLLKLSQTLFFWWPVYEICEINGEPIVETDFCIPKDPTKLDLNKFILPKTFEDITDKCIAEKLTIHTIFKRNANDGKAATITSKGKLNYHKIYGQDVAYSYIIHPISGKSIEFSDTRINSDILATCSFDVGNLNFHLIGNKAVGKFSEDCYVSFDESIKAIADEHLIIDAFEVKELVNNHDSLGFADYLTKNIGEISKIKLLLKYAGNECVKYKNSKGRTSAVEAFIQGETNGKAYDEAYNTFMRKYKKYYGYSVIRKRKYVKQWESSKKKPQRVIDALTNAGAEINFDEESYAELLKSKNNFETLDNYYFVSVYMDLIEYIETNKIQFSDEIINSIINSDYSYYSDLNNNKYRYSLTDDYLIAYALLDLLDIKPHNDAYFDNGHDWAFDQKISWSYAHKLVYSEITKKETPFRLYLFLSSLFFQDTGDTWHNNVFWTIDAKIDYLNRFNSDNINEVVLTYVRKNPFHYEECLPILEKYNSYTELIDIFKKIDKSNMSRYSKKQIKEANKYFKSKR